MYEIYEIADILEDIKNEKARCKETISMLIRSETFFRKYPRAIAAQQSKWDTLNELERRIETRLKKLSFINEID